MPPPTFGFSVGGFVAVTGLIVAVVRALQGISDDLVELKELQDELNHLKNLFDFIIYRECNIRTKWRKIVRDDLDRKC